MFLENVFVTEGVPEFTFIPPPNFSEILLDIRKPGKPVIIEGQSGTGKTTCVKKILEAIGAATPARYLTARSERDVEEVQRIVDGRRSGIFVIDDFHRLEAGLQSRLADAAKFAAEQSDPSVGNTKLVLIGINQIGSDLIQLVPDIAKRVGIHRIQAGTQSEVARLIAAGGELLNIEIAGGEGLFEESRGDYWLTQQLCQTVCTMNGVTETREVRISISFDLPALRARVVERLKSAYYEATKEFCRGQRFRPGNDPYFKLLRAIGGQGSSVVDLNELANANPGVRGSINNIKEQRLAALIKAKPICSRHFYYNPETKNFAIEDPALFYFLKHLDWNGLRSDCGFRENDRDYEYDFALSFAGEDRELAREIAKNLSLLDSTVFFDENFESNFLGHAFTKVFEAVFARDSRMVVCLLDAHHRDKLWPTFERQCFTPRVASGEVIPIFLDDTRFPGIPSELWGIRFTWDRGDPRWRDSVIDQIVFRLIDRA